MKSLRLILAPLFLAAAGGIVDAAPDPASHRRPNFVYIIGDDISAEDLG